jgi:hypothetical protein
MLNFFSERSDLSVSKLSFKLLLNLFVLFRSELCNNYGEKRQSD